MNRKQKILNSKNNQITLISILLLILIFTSCMPKPETAIPTTESTATALIVPTDTLLPTLEPTIEPSPSDPNWESILENGRITVGVSADYPPFAYVGDDFTIQGFDLSLIEELGKRLDIPLDIKNMAFDGLINALQLNQIDMAIAAISQTQERDAYIDFSNVYYVSDDAILTHVDSPLTIDRFEDLASFRIGVQTGSVYETWLTNILVDAGLMQPQNLITFENPEDGLAALNPPNPQINFFVMDLLPAEVAVKEENVKIVNQGFNPQRYSIGVPQGSDILRTKVNQILDDMQKDGTLEVLAKQYLKLEKLPDYPTPIPTVAPATPSACLDSMAFVQDLTYPDNNMYNPPQVQPGTPIQKGWRIKNTGTCSWDNSYTLTYAGSSPVDAPVGGNPVAIQGLVLPGQTYDVYVNITAPYYSGRFQSYWTMRNSSGLYFGDRIYAGFDVIGQSPTQIPDDPIIYSFNSNRNSINEGMCVELSWVYGGTNLSRAIIYRNGTKILKDMAYSGSYEDCPLGTGRYEYLLVVDSRTGGSAQASLFVDVNPVYEPTPTILPTMATPLVINYFDVDSNEIEMDTCVNFSWSFIGPDIITAELYRDGEIIASGLPETGTYQECPPGPGDYEYKLKIASEYQTQKSFQYITVIPPLMEDTEDLVETETVDE
jgi:arginine/lysine/histidine transporter system substrate-binding protein